MNQTEKVSRWAAFAPVVPVIAILACFWVPVTSDGTSILWDAADYYRVVQDYLSQELHAGRLPLWTPYPWCGYPFLADPQVGAWYPLNWPFFATGVTSHILFAEHCLHAILAALGTYFLALRLVRHRAGAVLASLCYGLSGFFTSHSSHTTILQCAAWMPWLLLLFDRALESHALRNTLWGGLAAGAMILAGHFQTTLYGFLALGLFAGARLVSLPERWLRIGAVALAIPVIGTLLSSIETGPGLELAAHSVRATLSAISRHEGQMPAAGLATLVDPDFYGVISGKYHGPQDITQYYYYCGILLVPLAVIGLWHRSVRIPALMLTIPAIWYSMGHSAGLYLLIARLPGFSSVRAPVHVWFVPTLGLALLAAGGLASVCRKWPAKRLPAVLIVFTCADLFYFQSAGNPLAYARGSYHDEYGAAEENFRRTVSDRLPALTRYGAPDYILTAGPTSHFLDTRTEVTYGYGPLALSRYTEYTAAMLRYNWSLVRGLNVSRWLDAQRVPLPRAMFPRELVPVSSAKESEWKLRSIDQSRQALVPPGAAVTAQDGAGTANVVEFTPGHYRIHYRCATPSVLRVGNAYYDGWRATIGRHRVPVFPADHALLGVVVPPAEADLILDYHSNYLVPGALVTVLTAILCAVLLVRSNRHGEI